MNTSSANKSLKVMSAYEKQAENWLSAGRLNLSPSCGEKRLNAFADEHFTFLFSIAV